MMPVFMQPATVEVLRDERDALGRLHRVVALVDGQPVAFHYGRTRRWSCRACMVRSGAHCEHVALVLARLS